MSEHEADCGCMECFINWDPPLATKPEEEVMPDDDLHVRNSVREVPGPPRDATPGDPVRSEPSEVARVIEEAEAAMREWVVADKPAVDSGRRLWYAARGLLAALREAEQRAQAYRRDLRQIAAMGEGCSLSDARIRARGSLRSGGIEYV